MTISIRDISQRKSSQYLLMFWARIHPFSINRQKFLTVIEEAFEFDFFKLFLIEDSFKTSIWRLNRPANAHLQKGSQIWSSFFKFKTIENTIESIESIANGISCKFSEIISFEMNTGIQWISLNS